jgi:hypothetical protein
MSVYYRKDRDAFCAAVTDPRGRKLSKFFKSEAAARTWEAALKATIRTQRAQLGTLHAGPGLMNSTFGNSFQGV